MLQIKSINKHKIFSLNDQSSMVDKLSRPLKNFKQLAKIPKNSLILLEDVISLTKKEHEALRHLLNYKTHHFNLKTYTVAHHLFRTGLLTSLPFFNYIIFSNTPSSLPLIKLSVQQFSFSEKESASLLETIKQKPSEPFQYFVLDCKTLSVYFAPTLESLMETDSKDLELLFSVGKVAEPPLKKKEITLGDDIKSLLRFKFQQFVQGSKIQKQAEVVFEMILDCVPLSLIRKIDLCFQFKYKTGEFGFVSLVDYIFCLLTKDTEAAKEIQFFHSYLKKFCTVPNSYIVNKNLK